MSSKHPAHRQVLHRGIFDNLSYFSELEARISALDSNKESGDASEVFAETYISTQKIALSCEVWPFEATPVARLHTLRHCRMVAQHGTEPASAF